LLWSKIFQYLRATNDQFGNLAKQRHQEIEQSRVKIEALAQQNGENISVIKHLREKLELMKAREKDDRVFMGMFKKAMDIIGKFGKKMPKYLNIPRF